MINLSYYKDVVFASLVAMFYLGVFYNQDKYDSIKVWGKIWFSIALIFIVITLLHNFKSAFYTKYSYYTRKMQELDGLDELKGTGMITNDVKFWLRESARLNYNMDDSMLRTSDSYAINESRYGTMQISPENSEIL